MLPRECLKTLGAPQISLDQLIYLFIQSSSREDYFAMLLCGNSTEKGKGFTFSLDRRFTLPRLLVLLYTAGNFRYIHLLDGEVEEPMF